MNRSFLIFFYILFFPIAIYHLTILELLIGFLIGWLCFGLGISVVLHRYVSHKSFEFKNNFYKTISYIMAFMSGMGDPIHWALIHRRHHRFTDKIGDTQSPLIIGKLKCFTSQFEIPSDRYNDIHYKQLSSDKFNYFFTHYQIPLLFLYPVLVYFMFGYNIFLMLIGIGVTVAIVMQGYINTFLHSDPIEDGLYSKNMKGSLFWFGENLHRSHHINSRRHSNSEFDLAKYFIRLVGKDLKN